MENSADMLGHLSIQHYSCQSTVTMCRVQTISREGENSTPNDYTPSSYRSGRMVI